MHAMLSMSQTAEFVIFQLKIGQVSHGTHIRWCPFNFNKPGYQDHMAYQF